MSADRTGACVAAPAETGGAAHQDDHDRDDAEHRDYSLAEFETFSAPRLPRRRDILHSPWKTGLLGTSRGARSSVPDARRNDNKPGMVDLPRKWTVRSFPIHVKKRR